MVESLIERSKILIVDDIAQNIQVAAGILKEYNIFYANDGKTALSIAGENELDLILLDVMMPEMDGFEVCSRLKNDPRTRNIPVIFLTASSEIEDIVKGFELGAQDYLSKPFQAPELLRRVRNHLELKHHKDRLEKLVSERTEQLQKVLEQAVGALASALEKKDPYTAGHQRRVSRLAGEIARKMQLSSEQVDIIELASLVHDIGKIRIPSELLANPGKLSSLEMELIKTHSQAGFEILNEVEFPWPIAQIVLQHHECIDGSGYPRGVSGNDLLLESRIISVSDVVEAMGSHRPYRPSLGLKKAIYVIQRFRGIMYDKDVVDVCIDILKNDNFDFERK